MTTSDTYHRFLSVIDVHKGIIYKVANSFCADAEDRKDLVQEIILRLWKSFDSYDDQYKYATWIYRVALNAAISFHRKEKSRYHFHTPLSEGIFNLPDLEGNHLADQRTVFLARFIAELKELDRALMLLYLDEKSHKEIAEIIGITETNVATKIGRIKQVLKQKFTQLKP